MALSSIRNSEHAPRHQAEIDSFRLAKTSALVVTGMHRSGTSLLASFLRAAGVNLGEVFPPPDEANPSGYLEDLDFLELQREMLLACTAAESGWRDWGWTESQKLDFSHLPSFRPRAEALVRRRQAAGRPWGWKDPRTTILLDFWDAILPDARYVFIYRVPWEVAASIAALQRSPFREYPDFAPRAWSFYNRQILNFYRGHRDRCLLIEAASLLSRPDEVLDLLRSKLGLPLPEGQDGAAILRGVRGTGRLGRTGSQATLWQLSAKIYHRESELWAALERAADLPAGLPLAATSVPEPASARPAAQIRPAAAIVIPCFNQGEFLLAAVASAERSEGVDLELVIVNDGSTDPFTNDILERLRAAGYRILDQPNRGLSAARNAGIRATRGSYILPLDADNQVRSSYLRRAAMVLDSLPAAGVVYGDAAISGDHTGLWLVPEFNLDEMATGNRIDACAVFRREVWEQCGGYDEDILVGWEDWDYWLSVAEAGWQFVHVPEVLFEYRVQSASMSAALARPESRRQLLEFITAKHPAIFQPRFPKMFAEKDAHWLQAEARAALLDRQLESTRRDLQAARDDLHAAQRELHAVRSESQEARGELAAARGEIGRWQERLDFMIGTRAWRLRSHLLRLRAAIGLSRRS
ncbi:MAG: glycosyltransferase [Acidobacteria bacterium]|nr:glycosyltransferase [Acidobacteriota bacterium]